MRPDAAVTAPAPVADAAPTTPPPRRRARQIIAALTAVALLGGLIGGIAVGRVRAGLDEARRLADEERWGDASAAVSRYLRFWPHDAEARLLAAEVLVRATDATGRSEEAVSGALGHLGRVPDGSPQGAEARLRAARLLLLVQRKPHAAEAQLRRAIARDPDLYEAHVFLWRIFDLTRRSDWAEPTFREVMRLAPPDRKIDYLRHWYLSQFAPAGANLELDRLLGAVPAGALPTEGTELARYEMFRAAEPESPIHAAAAARLLIRNDQAQQAAELLDGFGREAAWVDPFFAATRAEAAHAAGDAATFEEVMRRWPEPRTDYEYLKWEGVRLEENADDPAAAAESYGEALKVWPGPVDWQVVFRLSNCLRRLGRADEAERAKARSDGLERLASDDYHRPLRFALADPADPAAAARAADFYDAIGRPWEAGLWREHAALLRRSNSAITDRPTPALTSQLPASPSRPRETP